MAQSGCHPWDFGLPTTVVLTYSIPLPLLVLLLVLALILALVLEGRASVHCCDTARVRSLSAIGVEPPSMTFIPHKFAVSRRIFYREVRESTEIYDVWLE